MKKIYLDYAAGTPMSPEVLEIKAKYEAEFYNPSAIYLAGQNTAAAVDNSRKIVADILGAKPAEIIFLSGATEAINLAIGGVLKSSPGRAAVAATEHKAVLEAAKAFARAADTIPVNKYGLVEPASLKKALKPDTTVVSIAMADSEIGAVQQFRRLLPVIKEERKRRQADGDDTPLYLHTDASQAANYLDLHVNRLGVDLMSLGGNKIYGPKSAGVLYAKHSVNLKPLVFGGGQERGLRSGTEDTASIAAFARALKMAQSTRSEASTKVRTLRDKLAGELLKDERISLNGRAQDQLPNFLNLTVKGYEGEWLVMKLDEMGLMAGTGAACTLKSDQPSHVLLAIGLSAERANSGLRLTLGRQTTAADAAKAARIIKQAITS